MMMYCQDYDGGFPSGSYWWTSTDYSDWTMQIEPYVGQFGGFYMSRQWKS